MKVKLTRREPTDTMDRLFQRHLADAKRTVERLSKPRATPDTAALIQQAEEDGST